MKTHSNLKDCILSGAIIFACMLQVASARACEAGKVSPIFDAQTLRPSSQMTEEERLAEARESDFVAPADSETENTVTTASLGPAPTGTLEGPPRIDLAPVVQAMPATPPAPVAATAVSKPKSKPVAKPVIRASAKAAAKTKLIPKLSAAVAAPAKRKLEEKKSAPELSEVTIDPKKKPRKRKLVIITSIY
jgi:hypothetical protein